MKEFKSKPMGRTYRVVITETLRREIAVYEDELKQPTAEDAVQTVSDWWHQGQIILNADDFTNVEFSAYEANEEDSEVADDGRE